MDELGELVKNKARSPLNAMYFDEKYDIPNQVNLLPADDGINNPSNNVNLPPPLPGVFIFDQPHQNTNKSLIDSNFNPLVTSSYENKAQTLSKMGAPNANQYQELGRAVPETILNQKYFQSPTLNVYNYQTPVQKKLDKLPPPLVSDVDSMLPPQGNVYQSLEPVSVNLFDTAGYCEPKVYQQLEPVSSNEYRLDMGKFVEQKFYQELNPLSVNDSKLPKNEKKTYQQLRTVPDLHFIGEQSNVRSAPQTTQQKPVIPPEYATSKLYQQLSKPPKKQVRTNYPPERKSYHQLRPPGYIERPKHNLSKSPRQRANLSTPRPVTMHASSEDYFQQQTYHRQSYEAFQNVKVSDNNMTDPTINLSPMPNLSFPNKTHSVHRGFQEHKPKVYLELRNPEPRKQTTTSSGSPHTNFATDLPNQNTAGSYDECNISSETITQYHNVHPLQANDKQPNLRLPSPYEFKLPQTNMSNKYRMPKILSPNEYKTEQVLHSSSNHSLKPSQTVSSSNVIPPYHVDEEMSAGNNRTISFPLPETPACTDDPYSSGKVKYHEDLNQHGNKNETNKLPNVIADVSPEISRNSVNQQIDRNFSNNDFAHISSSVSKNKTIESSSYDDRSSVIKEKGHLMTNEPYFNYNSNTSDSKVTTDDPCNKYEIPNRIYSYIPVNLNSNSTVILDNSNGSFPEIKSDVSSPDFGSKSVMSSRGNAHPCSSNINSDQSSKEGVLYEKNTNPSTFSNVEDFSNVSTHLESPNRVTINKIPNEIDENVESIQLNTYLDEKTRFEEKLKNSKKPHREEPTDFSISTHAVEKMGDSSNCIDKNFPPRAEPCSETTNVENCCPQNNKSTTGFSKATSQENRVDERNQICLKSSSSSQTFGTPNSESLVKEESQYCTNEIFVPTTSVVSHATKIVCDKDLSKTDAPSEVEEKEKACQLSTMSISLLPSQNLYANSSDTVDEACSANVSPTNSIKSVVSSIQSESQINCINENKAMSGSSVNTVEQSSIALSDISTQAETEVRKQNIFTLVETVSAVNAEISSARDVSKEEKKKLHWKSFNNPQYTSFIPKKKRILCKTQLLPRRLKGSKSHSAISTDSETTTSLPEKINDPSETSILGKTSKTQSESRENCNPTTVSDQKYEISESSLISKASNLESTKLSEQTDGTDVKSLGETPMKVDEKEKLGFESLTTQQVSETQLNVTIEKITTPKDRIVSQSNVLVTSSVKKSKRQYLQNEDKAESESSKSKSPKNESASLKKQASTTKVKQSLSKKHKILQSEQHSDRAKTPPPMEIQTSKFQIGTNKNVSGSSQSEHCNTISPIYDREKEVGGDEKAEVQLNKSQSSETVSKQSFRSFGTRSSMKTKIGNSPGRISESINKRMVLTGNLKSCLDNSVKISTLSDHKESFVKDTVKTKYSRRVKTTQNPDVLENKDDINKSTSKVKTVTKSLSLNKSKSLRITTLKEKTSLKRKRKYCKTKKFEALSAVTKAEPLLKSKYSKRIIKKKKLDFEPVESFQKPITLIKRKYTITKYKSLPIKNDGRENKTSRSRSSSSQSAKIKYEFVDPLESNTEVVTASKAGLITDDEGEAVFLGFDSPQEEDDTVLGFDFKEDDDDMEPINEFLQQLDADSMTVECDPRSLLQAPGMTSLCPHCSKVLDSHQELVDHMRWHDSSGTHVCSVCLRAFSTLAQLDKHTKWNHDGGKRFSCPVCSKRFTTSYYIKKHLATVHGQLEAEVKYICPECTLSFTSEKKLTKHMDKTHKKTLHQCKKCLRNFLKPANLERHKCSHEEEGQKFPCAYCNKKFDNRVKLHAHWPVHSEKKLFTCEICNSNFTALPSLRRHKIIHAGEKLFRCDICQKSFALLSTLKTHLLVHSGIKRFPCKLCDKTFNRQDVLNAHQWIHTGEKKFECDICFQKFRWRHAVKSHKLIYHSTEKPYECETCGKRFSHPESFKKHGEVHAEKLYYCQICLKAFSRPSSLKIHILIHTDLKPFVCDLCNKSFRHKSHLRKHFLVHTSEKPWLCKFCNRMYKDRSQLRRHKRVVHCKNFFKKILPGMPENLKTVENFEMIAEEESALHTNGEYLQESGVLDSENLMVQSSKHFILSNLEGSTLNSEENSVPDSMEDKSSNSEENNIPSPNLEDHPTDLEDNYMTPNNAGGKLKRENVLPPSAF